MFWTRLASGVVLLILAIGAISLGGIPLAMGRFHDCLQGTDKGIKVYGG